MNRLSFDCRHRYPGGFQLDAAFEADLAGPVTALFGPSGAGKSTVFALVAGSLRPDSGSIRLAGRALVDTAAGVVLPPERRRVGVVFQDHLLFPHLTVRQNLTFGKRAGRSVEFTRLVEILEIGPLLERLPGALSGGQRQRVALGRALLRGPELLLMDEPLSGLEEGLKERILAYLERVLGEWRIPTLFISHDQADVRRLTGRVVILEGGRVVAAGPTASTLDSYLLARGRGRPRLVNLLRVEGLVPVGEHWEGKVGEQVLHLGRDANLKAGRGVCLQFLPSDVILATGSPQGLSVRNRLRGKVREVVVLPGQTFVALDVGQFLWAEVTPEASRELDLRPGQEVTCLVKSTAFTVLPLTWETEAAP